eukprot:3135738-Ditylum_brightwellii.AAC.1
MVSSSAILHQNNYLPVEMDINLTPFLLQDPNLMRNVMDPFSSQQKVMKQYTTKVHHMIKVK